ncbi:MAG TPA: hypothetical protein QF800_00520 [Phycisphaerales bacterium]|nr:hypothetical protein [Phycisphaerales bacterium]
MVSTLGHRSGSLVQEEEIRDRGGVVVTLTTLMHWTANRRKLAVLTLLTFAVMC